jgi:hypothetical protein
MTACSLQPQCFCIEKSHSVDPEFTLVHSLGLTSAQERHKVAPIVTGEHCLCSRRLVRRHVTGLLTVQEKVARTSARCRL